MLTNNFYNLFADGQNKTSTTGTDANLKNTQGTSSVYHVTDLYPFLKADYKISADREQAGANDNINAAGLFIGSDNTPATVNDYKLGNQIKSGFTHQMSIPNLANDIARAKKFTIALSVTNTSSDNLIINELGYVRSDRQYIFLLDRIVFETPVVITPGATKTFEYRLNMPQP